MSTFCQSRIAFWHWHNFALLCPILCSFFPDDATKEQILSKAYQPAGCGERACNSGTACTEGEMLQGGYYNRLKNGASRHTICTSSSNLGLYLVTPAFRPL